MPKWASKPTTDREARCTVDLPVAQPLNCRTVLLCYCDTVLLCQCTHREQHPLVHDVDLPVAQPLNCAT
eukprot:9492071-Pyramimonas_sp.AAC.1